MKQEIIDKNVYILGTRGIPADHGGFETLAHQLSLYLQSENYNVHVACQKHGLFIRKDKWRGVNRILIGVPLKGAIGSIIFDFIASLYVRRSKVLVLGYNTGIFNLFLWLRGNKIVTNLDGIEYKRSKYGNLAKIWLKLNEYFAVRYSHKLVCDHPEIQAHILRRFPKLSSKTTSVIAYGGNSDLTPRNNTRPLIKGKYYLTVCRIEPENNIEMIISAFNKSKIKLESKLIILGSFDHKNTFHNKILDLAKDNQSIIFYGPEYNQDLLINIRNHAFSYLHGHTVGGTNPSLVEAMEHSRSIIAHDNRFNRWVLDDQGLYFSTENQLIQEFNDLVGINTYPKNRLIVRKELKWSYIFKEYRKVLNEN